MANSLLIDQIPSWVYEAIARWGVHPYWDQDRPEDRKAMVDLIFKASSYLRSAGLITDVTTPVYRGFHFGVPQLQDLLTTGSMRMQPRKMESWTVKSDIGAWFATVGKGDANIGCVVKFPKVDSANVLVDFSKFAAEMLESDMGGQTSPRYKNERHNRAINEKEVLCKPLCQACPIGNIPALYIAARKRDVRLRAKNIERFLESIGWSLQVVTGRKLGAGRKRLETNEWYRIDAKNRVLAEFPGDEYGRPEEWLEKVKVGSVTLGKSKPKPAKRKPTIAEKRALFSNIGKNKKP